MAALERCLAVRVELGLEAQFAWRHLEVVFRRAFEGMPLRRRRVRSSGNAKTKGGLTCDPKPQILFLEQRNVDGGWLLNEVHDVKEVL